MSLFFQNVEKVKPENRSLELLSRHSCTLCPLADKGKVQPHGSKNPLIYILGDFPTSSDIYNEQYLTGAEGDLIHKFIPSAYRNNIRYNSIVRSGPVDNIGEREIACCRNSVVKDIEETAPTAIIGLGGAVLSWCLGHNAINDWRGRRVLVTVGKHTCWYYPILHPTWLLDKIANNRYGTDIYEHITSLDFKHIFAEIDNLPKPEVVDLATLDDGIRCINGDLKQVTDFFDKYENTKDGIGFDIETKNLRPYENDSKILSMSFSANGTDTIAFPIDHKQAAWTKEQKVKLNQRLKSFFLNRKGVLICHNVQFEQEWCAFFYGKEILRSAPWADTQIQAYSLDERYHNEVLKLDTLCLMKLGFNLKEQSNIDVLNLDNLPINKVLKYNARDALYTYKLCKIQHKEIKEQKLLDIYNAHIKLIPTLVLTQMDGLPIDQPFVQKTSTELQVRLDGILTDIKNTDVIKQLENRLHHHFNPASGDDVLVLLRDYLKVQITKKTKKGNDSLDKDVLDTVDHPIAKKIINFREITKIKSTYVDPLKPDFEKTVMHDDGLVHTNLNSMFTDTSRLSADQPNIQNAPQRKNKELVRPAFIAPPGHTFVSVDYGQIEARVIAMYSKDKTFVNALWHDLDVHQDWAEKISKAYPQALGKTSDAKAMKALRGRVKNKMVFPSFFGAGKKTVAGYMHIPFNVMEPLFDEFWAEFSGVHKWQKELGRFYDANGYVEFLNGRKRRGPLPYSTMINAPIQGLAANLVCDAYSRISEKAEHEEKPWLQPRMQVHDDLSYFIPNEKLEDSLEEIITEMLKFDFTWVNVPITVEIECGSNWYNKESIGTFKSNEWFK